MPDDRGIGKFCPHCGATDTGRIGKCDVCGLTVCLKCGSTQFIKGERKPVHNECIRKAGDGFSMIKFVR